MSHTSTPKPKNNEYEYKNCDKPSYLQITKDIHKEQTNYLNIENLLEDKLKEVLEKAVHSIIEHITNTIKSSLHQNFMSHFADTLRQQL